MTAAPSSKPIIRTQRLILREIRMMDLAAFHMLYSSEDVMRYWSNTHKTILISQFKLQELVSQPTNGKIAFAIALPSTVSNATSSTTPAATTTDEGKFIGHAGIWHEPRNELVFMIGQSYWRQGYMTEVLAAIMPILWQKGLKRVWANVNSDNDASIKLLRTSGFVQCGTSINELVEGNSENSTIGKSEDLTMEITNPDGGEKEGLKEENREEGDGGSDDDA